MLTQSFIRTYVCPFRQWLDYRYKDGGSLTNTSLMQYVHVKSLCDEEFGTSSYTEFKTAAIQTCHININIKNIKYSTQELTSKLNVKPTLCSEMYKWSQSIWCWEVLVSLFNVVVSWSYIHMFYYNVVYQTHSWYWKIWGLI